MVVQIDPIEAQEWLDALTNLVNIYGKDLTKGLLSKLIKKSHDLGIATTNTPYVNSVSVKNYPGNIRLEQELENIIRWNAVQCVIRATNKDSSLGGHLGTFASIATLYEVGFNHFWHAQSIDHDGDCIFFQGHSSPGVYARSFLENRITSEQLANFRQETSGNGLPSYPHPYRLPQYWQFATVSMGLGPLQAIYQARFMRYLQARNLKDTANRKVWCFCGDGEMDEPESIGALNIAARDKLDNLIFVVNCNLQRLDGPVYGNGKIIQELEGVFLGAGWRVIKVIWNSAWQKLLDRDHHGVLLRRMQEVVDGEYQYYVGNSINAWRDEFFGKDPELKSMVADFTDQDFLALEFGGHDCQQVYAAYKEAVEHRGQPVVILAKTVKGHKLHNVAGTNGIHNVKKLKDTEKNQLRETLNIDITIEQCLEMPFIELPKDSDLYNYLHNKRKALGGYIPARRIQPTDPLVIPPLNSWSSILEGSGERSVSTTMVFVRLLTLLSKDETLRDRIVPIVADEARTFGMEGLFRSLGIYSSCKQKYKPVDSHEVMFYNELPNGQILEEGINEAGAFASWLAAATSYSVHNITMIPFYIYYSMFGFQRVGDLAWLAGDSKARGFLLGATAGRTTLSGEGLQHCDGHSHILASTIPNCISYDPAFGYELAIIIHYGLRRMVERQEDVFFYITVMNENYIHPACPPNQDVIHGIEKGMYLFHQSKITNQNSIQLLGSGAILLEVIAASSILETEYNIAANIWSVTSFTELAREGQECIRKNLLLGSHKYKPYVTQCINRFSGPVLAATDYMRSYADIIRQYVPYNYQVLGTDGFGCSDTRSNLRKFFAVDRYNIVYFALATLALENKFPYVELQNVRNKYGIKTS